MSEDVHGRPPVAGRVLLANGQGWVDMLESASNLRTRLSGGGS